MYDGGVPITKDNCEDMFERWLERLDTQEVMDYADGFAKIMYIQGARDYIAEQLEKLKKPENYGDFSERDKNGNEITIDKWQAFLAIEKQKIPFYAVRTYANMSNGNLTYEEAQEIIKNYSTYEKKYGETK